MSNTKFKVLGHGYIVKVFNRNHPFYEHMQGRTEQEIYNVISDYREFSRLNIHNSKGELCQALYQLEPSITYYMYETDYVTRLEIKSKAERTLKLFFNDLNYNQLIFPPEYEISLLDFEFEGIALLERDAGHWGQTTHPITFDLTHKFNFELVEIKEINKVLVKHMYYNGRLIELKRPDTITFGTRVIIR